mmetsp:Transcript_19203/g.39716  ORF Transcript_19203/g.39716 Transcript_19203/m.39716 type:complete len:103 (-) Transcript_19203:21-329(-)
MTWFMKNAITQQSNGLWSLKKLHKLNNIHYYLPAKSCCDRSGASFLLIFCLTTPLYFEAFSTQHDAMRLHTTTTARPHNNNNNLLLYNNINQLLEMVCWLDS